MTVIDAKKPRRLSRPRWLDPRIIGGVLLVIASVVIGARVIGANQHTSPVWTAAHDLAAGTVLAAGDLVPADVNLGDGTDRYVASSANVIGQTLIQPLRAGELLPSALVGEIAAGRLVVVGVSPERMPPGVGHGSLIDLYLTSGGAGTQDPATELIGSGITVQTVTRPSAGGLSGASSSGYQITVLLDPATADQLVRTLPQGEAIVVLLTGTPK